MLTREERSLGIPIFQSHAWDMATKAIRMRLNPVTYVTTRISFWAKIKAFFRSFINKFLFK